LKELEQEALMQLKDELVIPREGVESVSFGNYHAYARVDVIRDPERGS